MSGFKIAKPNLPKLANILLQEAPVGAEEGELVSLAIRRWDGLHDSKIGEIVSLAIDKRKGNGMAVKTSEKERAALRKWLQEQLEEDVDQEMGVLFELAKKKGLCPFALETFRANYFSPIRTIVRKKKGLEKIAPGPRKGFKDKKPLVMNDTPINEVDAQEEEDPPIEEIEGKTIETEKPFGVGEGVAAEAQGPFMLPGDRELSRGSGRREDFDCDPACTVEIDSPMGTISYRLSVCGKTQLAIHSPDVDSFLVLTDFFKQLQRALTGDAPPGSTLPSILLEEDEARNPVKDAYPA